MLPVYILSKYNIRPLNGVLFQWRNNMVRLCSSSSDSDSDTEKSKSKKNVKNSVTSDNRDNLGSFLNNMIQQTVSTKMAKDTRMVKDTHSENARQETTKMANATDLTEYINNMMMKARKLEKTIDVAMPKKKSKNSLNKTKHVSYEKKLISAAENVASTLGGDKTKTTSDLLQKVLASRVEILREEQLANMKLKEDASSSKREEQQRNNKYSEKKSIIHTLLKEYNQDKNIKQEYKVPASRVEILREEQLANTKLKEDASSPKHEEQQRNDIYSEKKSIIHTLLKEYNQDKNIKQSVVENSIGKQLLNNIKISAEQLQNNDLKRSRIRQDIDLWNGKSSRIFENMNITPPNIPELKTWATLEQRELKALMTYPPANIFQELILWTEQGKLWKFPINNEQGMEEEQNIHFSEHVFMERHLKEWCPKSGPIRHFMELVCTGLSKNPYLTVQEKINHIMWYKDFFESKQDLLQELGAIQKPFPDKAKEIKE